MLLADLVVVALLLLARSKYRCVPAEPAAEGRQPRRRLRFDRSLVAAPCCLILATSVVSFDFAHAHGLALSPLGLPDSVDVEQGATQQWRFVVRNDSSRTVCIDTVLPSCECVELEFVRSAIEPGESLPATLRLDLSQQPDFTGHLRISASAQDEGQAMVLALQLRAHVIARATGHETTW